MTDRLGAIKLGESNGEPFLGRDFGHTKNYSEDVAAIIDEETKKLLANAHQEAFDILVTNREVLDRLVTELLEHETIDRKGLEPIFADVQMRAERPAWTGSSTRTPSDIPPVDIPLAARMNGRPEPQAEITVSPGAEAGGPSSAGPAQPPSPPSGGPPTGPPGSQRVDPAPGSGSQD
jgi:cell division protease FtsH